METLILLLKHLSLEQWLSHGVSQRDRRRGCRMQGRGGRVTHIFHLHQLCSCVFYSVGSHKISFEKESSIPQTKQTKTTFASPSAMFRSLSWGFHHFLLGLLYSSHWYPALVFPLCYPPFTLLPKWSFSYTNPILAFVSTGHLLNSYHLPVKFNFIGWHWGDTS